MDKFNNKYRTTSTRMRNWNYAWKGKYFVTLLAHNRENYFGEIIDGEMHLSEIGSELERQWLQTACIRADMNLTLDEFQVMPNHFHGILVIGRNEFNNFESSTKSFKESLQTEDCEDDFQNEFGPQRKTLGSVLRGVKSSVTSYATDHNLHFKWHPNFHDALIRDEDSLNKIRRYIQNNVKNWKGDRFSKR
jgi:putative transposase